MSVAMVPDRFFSIYGKAYPIKRRQTVGINQPSEAFKYEIIYLRGYDKYDDEQPQAKIIYHKQQENYEKTKACATTDDDVALRYLDDMNGYPYLKLRVCYDGSVKAYLGSRSVDWDLTRQIEDNIAEADRAWVEIPQINTDQFRNLDLWLRFDSINALSYYIMTKYENNIFDIGPKEIVPGLPQESKSVELITKEITTTVDETEVTETVAFWHVPAGNYAIRNFSDSYLFGTIRPGAGPSASGEVAQRSFSYIMNHINDFNNTAYPKHILFTVTEDHDVRQSTVNSAGEAVWVSLLKEQNYITSNLEGETIEYVTDPEYSWPSNDPHDTTPIKGFITAYMVYGIDSPPCTIYIPAVKEFATDPISTAVITYGSSINIGDEIVEKIVDQVVGLDYSLKDPDWTSDTTGCVPCCKKDNLSRSIWAYVNPRTMTPYDDDYWFHQGEPYYKKSLTLSTKQNPLSAQKIYVEQGVFPGMYKIVAETYIRARDTGEDQRVQITLPLCKIKSDQTLTLQADGDPTTFNLDVEVATPQNGVPMEITFYEVEKEMKQGCSGNMVPKDGSTKISAK